MKNNINYYYNFNIKEVENYGDSYYFKVNKEHFYFIPYRRDLKELDDIIMVSRELKMRGIPSHDIIVNRYGNVITTLYNENYVLVNPKGNIKFDYDITYLLKFNQSLRLNAEKSKLYHNEWVKLWSNKIDYFEYQVHELGKDKPFLLDTFSYYVGLGENAISYVNMITSKTPFTNEKITLSHKRIKYPNIALNYLNPFSFIFDLEVRDIAEYLKSSFFAGEDALEDLKYLLRRESFSFYSLGLLYGRLLFPTYYFDLYEEVMKGNMEEDVLIPVIEKAEKYEEFLKDAYLEMTKYQRIDRIDWLFSN